MVRNEFLDQSLSTLSDDDNLGIDKSEHLIPLSMHEEKLPIQIEERNPSK